MDANTVAVLQEVFDEHATVAADGAYIHRALLMRALREAGLAPSEEALQDAFTVCTHEASVPTATPVHITYPRFQELYHTLAADGGCVFDEGTIAELLAVFDSNGSGRVGVGDLRECLTSMGEALTASEVDGLLSTYVGAGEAEIEVEKFAKFLYERHVGSMRVVGGAVAGEVEGGGGAGVDEDEVARLREAVGTLRAARVEEALQRQAGFPSRLNDTADLAQSWFRGTHIAFMSYESPPGDAPDRLAELLGVFADASPDTAAAVGFYPVRFVRGDTTPPTETTFLLSHEDVTVADMKRLVSDALNLAINNVVFTVQHGATQRVIAGHPLERGGGSFLSQLFAAYTDLTGDDNPAAGGLEVGVARQPDIVQLPYNATAVRMTEELLVNALYQKEKKVELARVVGERVKGHTADGATGSLLVFAERAGGYPVLSDPGLVAAQHHVRVDLSYITFDAVRTQRGKVIPVVHVDEVPDLAGGSFPFRCGVVIDASAWDMPCSGQPLALYRYEEQMKGGAMWTGFSLLPTPVMVETTGDRIHRLLIEFHQPGLYYVCDAQVELIVDEGILDGRINKRYDVEGKAKIVGGRKYYRPWGWTRKGLQMKPWKIDTDPANIYHGSELEFSEWMLAPRQRRPGGKKPSPQDRTAYRTIQHAREEWRPATAKPDAWELWRDGEQRVVPALFFSPSLSFTVFRPFYQYYSLLLSCDDPALATLESAEASEWVTVPQTNPADAIVRVSMMCYVDAKQIKDVDHPFRTALSTVDNDFKETSKMECRVPYSRCRPVGLLLKRFQAPPEGALRRRLRQWAVRRASIADPSNATPRGRGPRVGSLSSSEGGDALQTRELDEIADALLATPSQPELPGAPRQLAFDVAEAPPPSAAPAAASAPAAPNGAPPTTSEHAPSPKQNGGVGAKHTSATEPIASPSGAAASRDLPIGSPAAGAGDDHASATPTDETSTRASAAPAEPTPVPPPQAPAPAPAPAPRSKPNQEKVDDGCCCVVM